jgi:hypothetical protein
MTNTPLTKTELAHVYTVGGTDEAPVVDGLGNPRFLSIHDFPHDSDPDYGLSVQGLDAVLDQYRDEYLRDLAESDLRGDHWYH